MEHLSAVIIKNHKFYQTMIHSIKFIYIFALKYHITAFNPVYNGKNRLYNGLRAL